MDDCIFCKIVKGDIPAYKVYEDEKVFAFLDINPLSKGHTLILPKQHYKDILDVPPDLYGYMFEIAKKIAVNINKKYKPKGIFVNQNNGEIAGQSVFHVHIHLKPMYEDTPRHEEESKRKKISEEEMKEIQGDLSIS